MAELIQLGDILAARERLRDVAVVTPVVALDPDRLREAARRLLVPLPDTANLPLLLLKNEAAQPIGSFKLRGAYNKVAALAERNPAALQRGVITFSSGNHAQGVAYAARALGAKAVIVMPNNAPEVKRRATEALRAEIVTVGPASTERKIKAEELVERYGYAMIPPYDDMDIIAGQATCGLEIAEQLGAFGWFGERTLVLSPVSGGGLLSGVASGVKLSAAAQNMGAPAVWGCEPALAADAHESFYAGQLVEWPAAATTRTVADGLRTQSLGVRNFAHVQAFADGVVRVTEEEIRAATRLILEATDIVAEPSGAVTLAAALFHRAELPECEALVAIVSGGNLDPQLRADLEYEPAWS